MVSLRGGGHRIVPKPYIDLPLFFTSSPPWPQLSCGPPPYLPKPCLRTLAVLPAEARGRVPTGSVRHLITTAHLSSSIAGY